MLRGFEDFWTAYPVKRSKIDALKAWNKIQPDEALLQQMLEAIEDQKHTKQWRFGYTPYPATWLRKGCWMDQLGPNDYYQSRWK